MNLFAGRWKYFVTSSTGFEENNLISSPAKGFSQFEIIINVLASSFRFIWIPMLWVYGHYEYFYSYSAGIDFNRQNLILTTKVAPCTERVKMYWKLLTLLGPSAAINLSAWKCMWFCEMSRYEQCFKIVGIIYCEQLVIKGLYRC